MSRLQHKILTRLKSSAATKRLAHGAGDNPLDAKRKELAEQVKDSSDKNRHFFAVYLGLSVYVLLMVFSTTDQMLLVPTQGIKLPLADIYMPLLGFYWSAPLILLALHFVLLKNIQNHHYKLMRWQKECDGIVPHEEIPVFLFNYGWLEHDGTIMGILVRLLSRILFLSSGPFALGIVLWRFTDYQDIWITSWHLAAFFVDSYLVWQIRNAFEKNEEMDCSSSKRTALVRCRDWIRMIPARLRCFFHNSPIYWLKYGLKIPLRLLRTFLRYLFTLLVLLQFMLACWFCLSSNSFLEYWPRINGCDTCQNSSDWLTGFTAQMKQQIPSLHSLMMPIISINPNETAWIPTKEQIETQALVAEGKEIEAQTNTVKDLQRWKTFGFGINLAGRHLRGFSAIGAELSMLTLDNRTDMRGAMLRGASLNIA